jgi:hypothetical protein
MPLDAALAAHSPCRAEGRETPWGADGLPRRCRGAARARPRRVGGGTLVDAARSALTSTPVAAQRAATLILAAKRGLPARCAQRTRAGLAPRGEGAQDITAVALRERTKGALATDCAHAMQQSVMLILRKQIYPAAAPKAQRAKRPLDFDRRATARSAWRCWWRASHASIHYYFDSALRRFYNG